MKLKLFHIGIFLLSIFFTYIAFNFIIPKITEYDNEITDIQMVPTDYSQSFFDIDGDNLFESFMLFEHENNSGINIVTANKNTQLNFQEKFLRKEIIFGDYNNDSLFEGGFVTKNTDSIFINILRTNKKSEYKLKRKLAGLVSENKKTGFDAQQVRHSFFYDLNGDSLKEFIFGINAEFSYQPRKLYAYDIKNDTVLSSPISGAFSTGVDTFDFDRDGKTEFYFNTAATSNYTNLDQTINYPDSMAWLMIFKNDLSYFIPPKGYGQQGSDMKIQPLTVNNSVYIAVFVRNNAKKIYPRLFLYNTNGKLLRKRTFTNDKFQRLIALGNTSPDYFSIYLYDNKGVVYTLNHKLLITNEFELNKKHKYQNRHTANWDINNDGNKELVFVNQKNIAIYDDFMTKILDLDLAFENFNYVSFYVLKGELFMSFKAQNDLWYTLKIIKNKWFKFRQIIYLAAFLMIYLAVYLIRFSWIKKLQYDNDKLNNIIEERTHEIEQQKLKLEESAEFRQQVSSMLVHDLKNPLQAIINISDLNKNNHNSNLKAYTEHMLHIIMNFMDVQKQKKAELKLLKKPQDITQSLTYSINSINTFLIKKHLKIINNINKKIIASIDESIIQRVFINILSNAIKYSNNNDTINIDGEEFTEENTRYYKFRIKDNGPGISAAEQKQIFNLFYSASQKKDNYSTGLGLTFCRTAIRAHKGKIGVISEVNKGAEIWFTLPILQLENRNKSSQKLSETPFFSQFSEEDIRWVTKKAQLFENIAFFELSKLHKTLDKIIPETQNQTKWLIELEKSIFETNEKQYFCLLNKFKKN